MQNFFEWLSRPWPWYIAGPLIGLMVPVLLLMGNKAFGISSSLRHICAVFFPSGLSFFRYDWRKELWNLFFVAGVIGGAFFTVIFLSSHAPVQVNPKLVSELQLYGITDYSKLAPVQLFNWHSLFS